LEVTLEIFIYIRTTQQLKSFALQSESTFHRGATLNLWSGRGYHGEDKSDQRVSSSQQFRRTIVSNHSIDVPQASDYRLLEYKHL
jgi:hypothetical protein